MSVDVSKIKAGDEVTIEFPDDGRLYYPDGNGPVNPVTGKVKIFGTVYDTGHRLCVGGWPIHGQSVEIIEHIPAEPDWAQAQSVRGSDGTIYYRLTRRTVWKWRSVDMADDDQAISDEILEAKGAVTVIIDKDGENIAAVQHGRDIMYTLEQAIAAWKDRAERAEAELQDLHPRVRALRDAFQALNGLDV